MIGHRAIRDAVGDRVYRASQICVDWTAPTTDPTARLIEELLRSALAGEFVGLARHPLTYEGQPVEVGQARFAADEQWWLGPPASSPGDPLLIGLPSPTVTVVWDREYGELGAACSGHMEVDTPSSRTDGRQVIGQLLRIDEQSLSQIVGPGRRSQVRAFACQHLECAEGFEGACEDACQVWHLPIAVEFQRLEAVDRADLCGAATGD